VGSGGEEGCNQLAVLAGWMLVTYPCWTCTSKHKQAYTDATACLTGCSSEPNQPPQISFLCNSPVNNVWSHIWSWHLVKFATTLQTSCFQRAARTFFFYWAASLRCDNSRGSRVRFPGGGGAGNFSLNHRVQTGSGAHPASYSMGTSGSLPGGKAAGALRWPLTST
jgi:hypothetical protein